PGIVVDHALTRVDRAHDDRERDDGAHRRDQGADQSGHGGGTDGPAGSGGHEPAPPISPKKTRNASRPSGEPRRQGSPVAVALPFQFKSSVTTADPTPNFTAFPDQPFMQYLPGSSPSPFPYLPSSPEAESLTSR